MNDPARGRAKGQLSTAEEIILELTHCNTPVGLSASAPPALSLSAPKICCLHLLCEAAQITPATDPSSALSTASLVFGLSGNEICHAFKLCRAGHLYDCSTQPKLPSVFWLPTVKTRKKRCCQR